jgi:hypothetical protein
MTGNAAISFPKMPGKTIYTSIPGQLKRHAQGEEYGEVYQRECINSWRQAGLNVVSINPESELEALKARGLDVELVSNGTANGRTTIGKILSAICTLGDDTAGIINADCFLVNPGSAVNAAMDAAKDSMVLLERLSIDPQSMRPTGFYCGGFDGFLFDTKFLGQVRDGEAWTIGSPQWDYWFPLVMHVAGAKLKKPDALILMHLSHPTTWSREEYLGNAMKLWRILYSMNLEKFPSDVAREIRNFGGEGSAAATAVERFLDSVASWLIVSRESFPLCPPGATGDFVRRILTGIEAKMTFG